MDNALLGFTQQVQIQQGLPKCASLSEYEHILSDFKQAFEAGLRKEAGEAAEGFISEAASLRKQSQEQLKELLNLSDEQVKQASDEFPCVVEMLGDALQKVAAGAADVAASSLGRQMWNGAKATGRWMGNNPKTTLGLGALGAGAAAYYGVVRPMWNVTKGVTAASANAAGRVVDAMTPNSVLFGPQAPDSAMTSFMRVNPWQSTDGYNARMNYDQNMAARRQYHAAGQVGYVPNYNPSYDPVQGNFKAAFDTTSLTNGVSSAVGLGTGAHMLRNGGGLLGSAAVGYGAKHIWDQKFQPQLQAAFGLPYGRNGANPMTSSKAQLTAPFKVGG